MNANLQSPDASPFPTRQPLSSAFVSGSSVAPPPFEEERCMVMNHHRRHHCHHHTFSTASDAVATVASTTNDTKGACPSPTKKRCCVHFGAARVVGLLRPASSMSPEERNVIWYAQMHLDDMKVEARRLCRALRTHNASGNKPSPRACAEVGLFDDGGSPSRGLEQRACHTRQRNKCLAIKCILKAQRKSRCPDLISRIASQCTEWARQLARDEATKDFCEVYYPHLASQVEVGGPATRSRTNTSAFSSHLKSNGTNPPSQSTPQQPGSTETSRGSPTRRLLGQQDCMDRNTRRRLN